MAALRSLRLSAALRLWPRAGRSLSAAAKVIDLRSDTVTHPTPRMRSAMATCNVGDDVYGEDPTVNHLEEVGAKFLGKEASLFVPSGSMANIIAIAVHCQRGDELICGNLSHIFNWEAGGASSLFGVSVYPVHTSTDGSLSLERLALAIRPDDDHCARTRLVALENTHNMCGGKVLTEEYLGQVAQFCKEHNLLQHMDGARLVNAAIASGRPPSAVAEHADSVSMCLSKGLSAPVGSLLAGSAPFIARARRVRKLLGGGMRQAGVLAAAGLVALEDHLQYMVRDHANAARLAAGLQRLGYHVIPAETNIVNFELGPAGSVAQNIRRVDEFQARLRERGVLVSGARPGTAVVRAVTHRNVDEADIDRALELLAKITHK